jgi:uncharacterized membrane protein YgaE (UPF0421/DUF939 family)
LRRVGAFLRRFFRRLTFGLRQGLVSVAAAFCAYWPTHLLGLQQDFWSAITAISVVQMEFRDSTSTARKQFTGAAIGGIAGLCLSLAFGIHLWVYAAAMLLSVLLCWALNVADASQLAAITSTIILLVPHTGSTERMLASRLSEVGWGVCVGIFIAWLENRFIRKIWP